MTVVDYVIIGLALAGIIFGLIKGFLSQLFGLAGLILVAIGTAYLHSYPMAWLESVLPDDTVRMLVALVATAILLGLIYLIISKTILKLFKKVYVLKVLDKLLGMVLGVGIVYVVVALLASLLNGSPDTFLPIIKGFLKTPFEESWVVQNIFKTNPLGDWLMGVIMGQFAP